MLTVSNFNSIYKSFGTLPNIFKTNGTELTVDRREGVRKYEHTPLSRQVESELDKHASNKDYLEIERKLEEYYSQYYAIVDNSLKYVFLYYKVLLADGRA